MKKIITIVVLVLIAIILMKFASPSEENNNSISTATNPIVEVETSLGTITLELYHDDAAKTVENFLKLADSGFYDGTLFHRVIAGFMIQGGDPLTKEQSENWAVHGTGGPGYTFPDEINAHKVVRGALAMANAGPNTNGSQFFIVTAEATPWLDGLHTVFGRVVDGMDVVDKIEAIPTDHARGDHPLMDVKVLGVKLR